MAMAAVIATPTARTTTTTARLSARNRLRSDTGWAPSGRAAETGSGRMPVGRGPERLGSHRPPTTPPTPSGPRRAPRPPPPPTYETRDFPSSAFPGALTAAGLAVATVVLGAILG